jgi:5'-nucleotidase
LKLLLTNDDGIDAEGLQCLYKQLSQKHECYVVAPDRGRSCCSHGVTTDVDLEVVSVASNQWQVSGTPADCVRIGLLYLKLQPDWVVSGVNHGGNLGIDVLYSGTAAGAREASLLNFRSVAISQYMRRDVERDWGLNAVRAEFVLDNIFGRSTTEVGFWNVNLPALPTTQTGLTFPVTDCLPESQPLDFSLERVDEPECGDDRQRVNYQSNYQFRPRVRGSDVDLCFSGNATVSWFLNSI